MLHHFLPEGLHKRPEGKRGEKSADVVVTSPPYNIGIGLGSFNDALPREKYLMWMEEVGVAIKWAIADDGSFFLKMGSKPKDQWIAWNVTSVLKKHFVLKNVIQSVKSIASLFRQLPEHCRQYRSRPLQPYSERQVPE